MAASIQGSEPPLPNRFASRDRFGPRLAELAVMLDNPTPATIAFVRKELERLVRG